MIKMTVEAVEGFFKFQTPAWAFSTIRLTCAGCVA